MDDADSVPRSTNIRSEHRRVTELFRTDDNQRKGKAARSTAYIERDGQLSAGLIEEFVEFIFHAVFDRVGVLGTKEVEDDRRWHGARAASDRGRVVQAKIRQMKRHGDGRLVCK